MALLFPSAFDSQKAHLWPLRCESRLYTDDRKSLQSEDSTVFCPASFSFKQKALCTLGYGPKSRVAGGREMVEAGRMQGMLAWEEGGFLKQIKGWGGGALSLCPAKIFPLHLEGVGFFPPFCSAPDCIFKMQ